MTLRGDHVVGDDRQEHADNHNLIEVFVRDFDDSAGEGPPGPTGPQGDPGPQGPAGSQGSAAVKLHGTSDTYALARAGDLAYRADESDPPNLVLWAALSDYPTTAPPDAAWEATTPVIPAPYFWAAETTYAAGDRVIVSSGGLHVYEAAEETTAQEPPGGAWALVAGPYAPEPKRYLQVTCPMVNKSYVLPAAQAVVDGLQDVLWVPVGADNVSPADASWFGASVQVAAGTLQQVSLEVSLRADTDGALTTHLSPGADLAVVVSAEDPVSFDEFGVVFTSISDPQPSSMLGASRGVQLLTPGWYQISLNAVWAG